ncbi:MAG TPA: SUMF1/EgtB/PvdO family nonheme iron enzyme [Candidatus Binatia bacterium]|nr:SUMF1/EgtB/PvdO family nonheme iron enzyme [Candidatus Binatia bacterium]
MKRRDDRLVVLRCKDLAMHSSKPTNAWGLGHFWSFFLPLYVFAAAAFDSTEVTNVEYLKFVLATRHAAPEHWHHGRFPTGKDNDPVVLVNFLEAAAYCRWAGKRLPTVDEWQSTCEGGKLKKRGDIWEWTSTDVDMGGQTYKALCGPGNSCDCSHRYLPQWKNEVKGFRCVQDSTPVTSLPAFIELEGSV